LLTIEAVPPVCPPDAEITVNSVPVVDVEVDVVVDDVVVDVVVVVVEAEVVVDVEEVLEVVEGVVEEVVVVVVVHDPAQMFSVVLVTPPAVK
jgi:hypothetical protein